MLWDDHVKEDARGEEILTWSLENSLSVLNDGSPTRFEPATQNPSTPDITMVDQTWAPKCKWRTGGRISDSDHAPVYIKVNHTVATQKIHPKRPTWKSNVDWAPFTAEIEEKIDQVLECNSMKAKIEKFNKILLDAAKTHVGKIRPGGRRKVCITPKARAAIRKRNKLRKDIRNRRDEWKEAAKEVRELKNEARTNA